MFDWLFGSKSPNNYDDTMNTALQLGRNNADAAAYYADNIDNGKWEKLDQTKRNEVANQYNQMVSGAKAGSEQYGTMLDAFNKEEKANRYNYFGNGLLGSLLNPIGQTLSAGKDLITGQYGKNDRDVASDLGALGETALTFLPGAGLAAKGSKVGKALTSVPGMAAQGAGFGVADAYRQNGSETELGDALSNGAMGAGFGAGIPIIGNLLKRRGSSVLQKQMTGRGMDPEAIQQTMGAIPNRALYSTAARSFIPKSTFGKVAVGGGALYGGSQLLNQGGGQPAVDPAMMNAQSGGDISEEQLYNYLMSIGAI